MVKVKVADKLEAFQRNIYPAMVDALAQELGLRAESLTKLGVGYVPVVSFKHGRNYNGWWCNPERDATGKVTAISLRGRMDGAKYMYPGGSRRGLIYPCQSVVAGLVGYSGGSHNWTRLYDANVDCPVCGKPDGCLVSSEDPHDPKAVICIRTEDGATKQTGFGWLHILKEEGRLDDGPHPLPDSDYSIVVVEGLTDTAAALGLGLVAVGRPNNTGGLGALADLVRGRRIVVVGENDRKADGDWPGKRGVDACMATLMRVCPHVVAVYPPDGRKDLREWLAHDGLGLEAFLEYVEKYGTTEESGDILPDSTPLHMADRWLLDEHTEAGTLLLRTYRGQWYRYSDGRYELVEEKDDVRGPLWRWSDNKEFKKYSADGSVSIERFEPTRSRVSDMVDALSARCPVAGDHPLWLDGRTEPDPHRLICFSNGFLDVDTIDTGSVELVEPSPELFTLANLSYAYDPDAACPQWLEFLDQILGDDPDKILLLQEWFGLCMTPDMSYEKFMLFQGRRRSGKGTSLEMLRALVGPKQVATTSFRALGERFGKQPLVGKLCAFMSDAKLSHQADSMAALETLLAITGQDAVNVDRKSVAEIPDHHLMCRFTIAVNELPSLPDHAQALEPRLLVLEFPETFEGREDWGLKRRLPKEAPGVALWALTGLRRLRQNGVFTLPKSSDIMAKEFRRITSPVVEFVEECCTRRPDVSCDKPILYDAWVGWCRERGLQPGPRSKLGQRVIAAFPTIVGEAAVHETHTRSRFCGIELDSWAHKKFLGGGPG